jgi:thioredoxin-dependent peroxiredoxin
VLAEGTQAPEFTLPDHDGRQVSLEDFRGRWLVLWWFPKAFTSGWTNELQGFRDRAPEFEELGVAVVGVSFDRPEDNAAFRAKHDFPFPLFSDVDHSVGEKYETKRAPAEQNPEYAKRRTYLIDPSGAIARTYRVTDIPGHPGQVLEDLRALGVGRQ